MIAWFSVDAVENDKVRKTVMLFGDTTEIVGGPITIEAISDDENAADQNEADDAGVNRRSLQNSILSGKEGGRAGRAFATYLLARDDESDDIVRSENEVAALILSPQARRSITGAANCLRNASAQHTAAKSSFMFRSRSRKMRLTAVEALSKHLRERRRQSERMPTRDHGKSAGRSSTR